MQTEAKAANFLCAKLIGRILHDLAGPTSGLTSALDLLADAPGESLGREALGLAQDGLGALTARMVFGRAAYGGGDSSLFERLLQTPFDNARARMTGAHFPPGAPPMLAQALLILSQISAEVLSSGGTAHMEISELPDGWHGLIEARGPRARLHADTALGLAGQDLDGGLPGRWAPARYLHAIVSANGGSIAAEESDGAITLSVVHPR